MNWLTDIETTADLTGKSRTKLAQSKIQGAHKNIDIRSFISNKTREGIKDSLYLKMCN